MPMPTLVRQQLARHQGRIELVVRYLTGQGILQVVSLLNGFFIIRWLDFENQAKFTIAMGALSTISFLSDLGFGGSLLSLVGNNMSDNKIVSTYLSAINYYKKKLIILSVILSFIVTICLFVKNRAWGYEYYYLYALVLIGALYQSSLGPYSAIMQAKGKLTAFYTPQIIDSFLRLLISFMLVNFYYLNSIMAVCLISIGTGFVHFYQKDSVKEYLTKNSEISPIIKGEVLNRIIPVLPLSILFLIQAQVSTFLISYYASYKVIAEIGALSRLGQFYSLLTPFTTVVLLPYFAKSSSEKLIIKIIIVSIASVLVTVPFSLMAFLYPDLYLLLLGKKFYQLKPYIGLFFISSSINYVSGVVWSIIFARGFTKWHSSIISLALTIAVQALCLANISLTSTLNILYFNFWTFAASLVVNFTICTIGIITSKNRL